MHTDEVRKGSQGKCLEYRKIKWAALRFQTLPSQWYPSRPSRRRSWSRSGRRGRQGPVPHQQGRPTDEQQAVSTSSSWPAQLGPPQQSPLPSVPCKYLVPPPTPPCRKGNSGSCIFSLDPLITANSTQHLKVYLPTFHLEIVWDFQKHCKKTFLYTLHLAFPNVNILHSHSTMSETTDQQ